MSFKEHLCMADLYSIQTYPAYATLSVYVHYIQYILYWRSQIDGSSKSWFKCHRYPKKNRPQNETFFATLRYLRWHTGVCDTRISCRYNHQSYLGGIHRVACCAILVENETQQVFISPACWKRPAVKHEAVQINTFPLKRPKSAIFEI